VIHVTRFGATVRVHRDGLTDIMTIANAARLLAGLEVALAAALREAGRGKCLRCGKVSVRENMPLPPWCAYELHCHKCGGILSPMPARVEG
jgi:hypothetical protein